MFNTEVLNEFFIWEENNLTELKNNCLNNTESVHCDTTTKIKSDSIKKDWRDITDPKLRKKMRDKAWYEANKDKVKLQSKNWYDANKDKDKRKNYIKSYRKDNKNKIKAQTKSWREANKDKMKLYKEVNKDKIKIRDLIYYESNKDKMKLYKEVNKNRLNSYSRNKRKTDIQYKLKTNLRTRLRITLKNNYKSGSAVRDLGCSIESFKSYLESKFQSGMSWDNYGLYGWHIDHIKPLSSFDLTDRKQLLEACHYTNLQPLWAKDNLSKSDKISNN